MVYKSGRWGHLQNGQMRMVFDVEENKEGQAHLTTENNFHIGFSLGNLRMVPQDSKGGGCLD